MVEPRTLNGLMAKARQAKTRDALAACKTKPTREKWLAAEKAAWADVSLDTNDALWVRAQALALPSSHVRPEEAIRE